METFENKKGSILIVEDDAISTFIAETLLQNEFTTYSVNNGYDAIKCVDEQEFDIVLMDINLGDEKMDGIRTMRLIKQNRKHRYLKVFAVTAFADHEEWFIKQGFDGLFLKPINEEMINVLKDVIHKKHTKIRKTKFGMLVEAV